MKNIKKLTLLLTVLLACINYSWANVQSVAISDGFVREKIPGTELSSAYMKIANMTENSVTLLGASSKISKRIEIHEHTMQNGMMNMRKRNAIVINKQATVVLQPMGLHLMIFDLKKPLVDGQAISLTLHFAAHPDVVVQLPVQSIKRKSKHHH